MVATASVDNRKKTNSHSNNKNLPGRASMPHQIKGSSILNDHRFNWNIKLYIKKILYNSIFIY